MTEVLEMMISVKSEIIGLPKNSNKKSKLPGLMWYL